jgi:hypothetical protein
VIITARIGGEVTGLCFRDVLDARVVALLVNHICALEAPEFVTGQLGADEWNVKRHCSDGALLPEAPGGGLLSAYGSKV